MRIDKGGKRPNYPKVRKHKAPPDWTGRKFGRLTVIRPDGVDKHSHWTFLCQCECGVKKVVPRGNLSTGNTMSCGCLALEMSRESGKLLPRLVLPYGVSQKKTVIGRYAKRGKTWALTAEQAEALMVGDCHYCGIPPSNEAKTRKSNGSFIYNGIDRIDSSSGYEIDNVVTCCKRCNVAKNDMTYDEFVEWVNRVSTRILERSKHAFSGVG